MSAPRLEIDLAKIEHNARTLVERLRAVGISVTAVTKVSLGSSAIAETLVRAGVAALGDSRIENIEAMRRDGVEAPMVLLRSPMIGQIERVVAHADVSLDTELAVIRRLSEAARSAGRVHGIILMVELGDLREGIMPDDVEGVVREVLGLPGIVLRGLGANLACQSGASPSVDNMAELSALADAIERTFDITLDVVSGGNSANLGWALGGADVGRINDLRLGESIVLGRDPLDRRPIDGLHTDAIALFAEVIEAKVKPSAPWGELAQTAFGAPGAGRAGAVDRGPVRRAIFALGEQDTDPTGLQPPPGLEILGASSDHLVVDTGTCALEPGDEVGFGLTYSALVRAMTSPFVARALVGDPPDG